MRNTCSGDTYHVLKSGDRANKTDMDSPSSSPIIIGAADNVICTSKGKKPCSNKGNDCCMSNPAKVPTSPPIRPIPAIWMRSVSYTHLRAHETDSYLVCRL